MGSVARAGDLDQLRTLVTRDNVSTWVSAKGGTVLHRAVCSTNDSAECVCFVVEMGAAIDEVNGFGNTPLKLAFSNRKPNCMRQLLLMGARIHHKRENSADDYDILARALSSDDVAGARWLIIFGARLQDVDQASVTVPQWARTLFDQREQLRAAAVRLIAVRRFGRSRVLASNGIDVCRLIARTLWDCRLWWLSDLPYGPEREKEWNRK